MLPSLDSRAQVPRATKALARHLGVVRYGEPLYCLSCGRQDGWVTRDLPPGVMYLCAACEAAYGVPAAMTARPDLDAMRSA